MPRPIHSLNVEFLEQLHQRYLTDPLKISSEWREFFHNVSENGGDSADNPVGSLPAQDLRASSRESTSVRGMEGLIADYRAFGHLAARIDPLGAPRSAPAELDPAFHRLDPLRQVSGALDGQGPLTVGDLTRWLEKIYCGSVGVEFMHIGSAAIRRWVIDKMEDPARSGANAAEQRRILERLTEAARFEEFIRKTFVGAKSFSLEGSESLIPLLDRVIEQAGALGVREIVLGMTHRGRLNVLANVVGKGADEIFREFDDADPEALVGRGDVKYHLGHSGERGLVHLSLCFNPSHIGYIVPVALGRVRAKQDRVGDRARERGLAVLIHGDAGFIGEGVIQESLNLSALRGYHTGGALHIIVNNQIGFTTDPAQGRSGAYASDIAKMLDIPIFHVNGEDLDAVAEVARLAVEFRGRWKSDVVIDLYGYRRLGHNETDEPRFTQPELYRAIERRTPLYLRYRQRLIEAGVQNEAEADAFAARVQQHLEESLARTRATGASSAASAPPQGVWADYVGGPAVAEGEIATGVPVQELTALLEAQTRLPANFRPHAKVAAMLQARRAMALKARPLDWAAAEALAFASLATAGVPIRLSGQDSARGTFSQRHGVLHDLYDGTRYAPLAHLSEKQAGVEFINSPLSEIAVLGFDYGYSLDYPEALVLWEAQFGDFANAAQVIIDQFIASAEAKWRRLSGLVLLLPHGLEGMGPEHSSARLERFLQLAAQDNLRIVAPTTPAQLFHCLRRQALSRWRKPLIVLAPKSLLRHPRALSSLDECAQGSFQRVIAPAIDGRVRRLLLTSGKLYYELEARRAQRQIDRTAIVRIEELYPFPRAGLEAALAPIAADTPVFWVQEEPENMGAWSYLCANVGQRLFGRLPLSVIARPESPSPATGSAASHRLEQQRLIKTALG